MIDLNNSAPNAQTEEVNIPQEEVNEVKAYENKEKAFAHKKERASSDIQYFEVH